jgi:hypothetical protein
MVTSNVVPGTLSVVDRLTGLPFDADSVSVYDADGNLVGHAEVVDGVASLALAPGVYQAVAHTASGTSAPTWFTVGEDGFNAVLFADNPVAASPERDLEARIPVASIVSGPSSRN